MGDGGQSQAQSEQSRKAIGPPTVLPIVLQNEFHRRRPLIRTELEVDGKIFSGFVEEGTRFKKGIASVAKGYGGGIGIVYNEKIKADELAVLVVEGNMLVKGGIDPAKVVWDGVSQEDRTLAIEYSKQSIGGLHFAANGGIPVLVEGDGNLVFPNIYEMKITSRTKKFSVYMQEGGPDLQTKDDVRDYYNEKNTERDHKKNPENYFENPNRQRKKTFVESASLRDTEIEVDESKLKIMDTDTGELIGLKDWNNKIEGFKYDNLNVKDIFIREIELSRVAVEQHVPILFGNEPAQVVSDFNFRHRSVRVISADDYVMNHIAYTQNPIETGQAGTTPQQVIEQQPMTTQQPVNVMQQAAPSQQADFLAPNPSHDVYDGNPKLTRPVIDAFNDATAYTPNQQEIPAGSERNRNDGIAGIQRYEHLERRYAGKADEDIEIAGEKKRRKRKPAVFSYASEIKTLHAARKNMKLENIVYAAPKTAAAKKRKLREKIKGMKLQAEDRIITKPDGKKRARAVKNMELPKEPKGKKKKTQRFHREKADEKAIKIKKKKMIFERKKTKEIKALEKKRPEGLKKTRGLAEEKIKEKKKTLKKPHETKKENKRIPTGDKGKSQEQLKTSKQSSSLAVRKESANSRKKTAAYRRRLPESLLMLILNGRRSRAGNSARRLSR